MEAHLQELLAAVCHELEVGMVLVRREYPTAIGPIDLALPRRRRASRVAIEVKRQRRDRRRRAAARYVERLILDSSLRAVRGMFVAQVVKPQARVLAESRGFTVLEVDYDELRGLRANDLKLFNHSWSARGARRALKGRTLFWSANPTSRARSADQDGGGRMVTKAMTAPIAPRAAVTCIAVAKPGPRSSPRPRMPAAAGHDGDGQEAGQAGDRVVDGRAHAGALHVDGGQHGGGQRRDGGDEAEPITTTAGRTEVAVTHRLDPR